LHLEGLPGNVRLDKQVTRLPKASVANIYDIQKTLRSDFVERVGVLPPNRLADLEDGLRLILDLH
jgi:mRNA-degrading endonuclease toxin of MazEF toxin-antitoxin module